MTRFFHSLLCFILTLPAVGQTVSMEQAMNQALELRSSGLETESFGNGARAPERQADAPLLTYTSTHEERPIYYVFSYPDGGFAIIGGDERAKSVLGYCPQGTFHIDSIPDGLRFMLRCYDEQIVRAMRQTGSVGQRPSRSAPVTKTSISKMLSTTWDQGNPYNSMLPSLGSGYTGNKALATGCGATAGAQILKYYNYPAIGVGSKSYSQPVPTDSATITLTFEADFANTTYDWANMLDDYSGTYDTVQAAAVGTLMYHIGVAFKSEYGQIITGGTSTYNSSYIPGFVNYFGYDSGATLMRRNGRSDSEWEDLVYSELAAGRPLFYTGQATAGGHAFCCDGYDAETGNFHFNWGWGGSCDGYYPLTGTGALQPNGSGIGGAGGDAAFTGSQTIIAGLHPVVTGTPVTSIILDQPSVSLPVGEELALVVAISPADATNQQVVWSSNNTIVATVSSQGVVTAVNPGSATITCAATDGSGAHASCTVTVTGTGTISPAQLFGARLDWGTINSGRIVTAQVDSLLNIASADFYGYLAWAICDDSLREVMVLTENPRRMTNHLGHNHFYVSPISWSQRIPSSIGNGHYFLTPKAQQEGSDVWADFGYADYGNNKLHPNQRLYLEFWINDGNVSLYPGDLNGDGVLDTDDVINVEQYLLSGGNLPCDPSAVDVNGDNKVTIADIVSLINALISASSAPNP